MSRARLLVATCAAVLLASPASCSEDAATPAPAPSSGGGGGAGGATTTSTPHTNTTWTPPSSTTTTSTGAGGAGCDPHALPSVVPAGWVEYTDWSCSCRFYVPGSAEALPPPLEWGPCPGESLGYDCRVLVRPGTADVDSTCYTPHFDVLPDGTALLGFSHSEIVADVARIEHVVAEADGRIHAATLETFKATEPPKCSLMTSGMAGGRRVLAVSGDGVAGTWTNAPMEGVIGGAIDDLHPTVLARFDDELDYEWTCNQTYVVSRTYPGFEVLAYPWSTMQNPIEKPFKVTSPGTDPDGLAGYDLTPIGEAIFFMSEGGKLEGLNVWTPATGARPFVRWLGDPFHGAGSLATDGKDMVWRYGEGRDKNGFYEKVTLMTSKFTTDPAAVVARPLHALSRVDALGSEPAAVGCGFAATSNPLPKHFNGDILVVRLSDGHSWSAPGAEGRLLHHVVGITCTDVFVLAHVATQTSIVRIALDSLGPGEPME